MFSAFIFILGNSDNTDTKHTTMQRKAGGSVKEKKL